MNTIYKLKFVLLVLIVSTAGFTMDNSRASEDTSAGKQAVRPLQSGELYLPSDNSMADVSMAKEAALKNNKLLLVVMGANWCHDSRALAARLYEVPLSPVIEQNYEIVFVDVGYLEKGRDVITSLGSPVYYATPTVLIVDPASGEVINAQNRHRWADAASINMDASVDYFQQMANSDLPVSVSKNNIPENLQRLLSAIDRFEQAQADRLYQAYAVLGPMLRAYKSGDKEAFSEEYWNAVRDFRYQVPKDVDSLRAEATERSVAGETDISLNYPEYPAFPWEK